MTESSKLSCSFTSARSSITLPSLYFCNCRVKLELCVLSLLIVHYRLGFEFRLNTNLSFFCGKLVDPSELSFTKLARNIPHNVTASQHDPFLLLAVTNIKHSILNLIIKIKVKKYSFFLPVLQVDNFVKKISPSRGTGKPCRNELRSVR